MTQCPCCGDQEVRFGYDGHWAIDGVEFSKDIHFCPTCGSPLRSLTDEESKAVEAIGRFSSQLGICLRTAEMLAKMNAQERRDYEEFCERARRLRRGIELTIDTDVAFILTRSAFTRWDES